MIESPSRRGFILGAAASLVAAPAIVRAASLMQLRGEPLRTLSVPLSKPRVWVSFDARHISGARHCVMQRLEGVAAADAANGILRALLIASIQKDFMRRGYVQFSNPLIETGPSAIEDFTGPIDDGATIMSRL